MRIFKKAVFVIMISFLIATVNVNTAHAAIDVSAKSAIIIDGASGRVLYAKDEHQKRRIASITKIMTAVLAIESGKMDQTVTVSANAVRTEGSAIYLTEGQKVKLKDLVYGLMLRSGNDAAVAIAEPLRRRYAEAAQSLSHLPRQFDGESSLRHRRRGKRRRGQEHHRARLAGVAGALAQPSEGRPGHDRWVSVP